MNIDDIIKTINETKYEAGATHVSKDTFDLAPEVVKALAAHMYAQKPEDLMQLIIRLTTDVEKSRLMRVNQALRKHEDFNQAMAKLHEWRAAQKP